jgi:hypothetical protein
LPDMLGASREHDEEFGLGGERLLPGPEHDVPERLPQGRPPWLPGEEHSETAGDQGLLERPGVRTLPAPLDPLEGQEKPARDPGGGAGSLEGGLAHGERVSR